MPCRFSTQLFARNAHSVDLTESGVFLLDCAEVMWGMLEESKSAIKERFAAENLVRIGGILDFVGLYPLVAQAEEALRGTSPNLSMHIEKSVSTSLESLVECLINDRIDCAVVFDAANRLDSHAQIESLAVGRMTLEITVPAKHQLARQKVVRLKDLERQSLIRLMGPTYSAIWRRIESRLQEKSIVHQVRPIAATTTYDAVSATSKLGSSLFISPRRFTPTQTLRNPSLVTLPLDPSEIWLDCDLVALKEADSISIEDVASALRQAFADFYPETTVNNSLQGPE